MTWVAAILIGLGGSQIISRLAPPAPRQRIQPKPQFDVDISRSPDLLDAIGAVLMSGTKVEWVFFLTIITPVILFILGKL